MEAYLIYKDLQVDTWNYVSEPETYPQVSALTYKSTAI